MANRQMKKKIIIMEDAKRIAKGYKVLLQRSNYEISVCNLGEDGQALIDKGCKFDLAIMDVVLPPEDLKIRKLKDCKDTGLRLIKSMIKNGICRRFYVITVRGELKKRIEALCRKGKAVLKFESKLDHEPEEFVDNVAQLLAKPVPK
ncbi:MAG: response regulator [Planctomycetota bacterium]